MKTANPSISTGYNVRQSAAFSNLLSALRSKITDKMCITTGVTAIAVFIMALIAGSQFLISLSGLIALLSVAAAPTGISS